MFVIKAEGIIGNVEDLSLEQIIARQAEPFLGSYESLSAFRASCGDVGV